MEPNTDLVLLAERRAKSRLNRIRAELMSDLLEHQMPQFAADRDESAWRRLDEVGEYTWDGLIAMWDAAAKIEREPIGRCILQTMCDYIIGRTAEVQPVDEDEKVQKYWDAWQKDQHWDAKSKEAIKRTLRDGELFPRWFKPRRGQKHLQLRFVRPPQIAPSRNGRPSYGISVSPDDYEDVKYYNRVWTDDGGTREQSEQIKPGDMDHWKILVDSDVKRGVSFFVGIARWAGEYKQWLHDRVEINRIRHIFNVVGKVTGGDLDSFEDELAEDETYTAPGDTPKKKRYRPGGILLQEGVEWELQALNINASDTAEDGRAIQLMIAVGTNLPEYVIRGDASNANYASTMVSESPFVKAMESWQDFFNGKIEAVFERVINHGIATGEVPTKTTKVIKGWDRDKGKETEDKEVSPTDTGCTVNNAVLLHRDIKDETDAYVAQVSADLVSKKTAREKLGYDNEEELDQLDKEDREAQEAAERWDVPQVPVMPGQPQPPGPAQPKGPDNGKGSNKEK